MVQQKYNLTFSHSDHWKDMLKKMITTEEFADVTLVTDDMKQLRAHRNILSACSPVFKSILQIDNNSPNSVIYMRGVQSSEIESIMQFIYLGEARFYEARMNEFLLVSKSLEIRDLATGIELNEEAQTPEQNLEQENNIAAEEESLHCMDEDAASIETSEDHNMSEEASRNVANQRTPAVASNTNTKGTKLKCKECEREFTTVTGLKFHTKSTHEGVKYACNQCDHQFTAQSNLTLHIKSKHEGVKYTCKCKVRPSKDQQQPATTSNDKQRPAKTSKDQQRRLKTNKDRQSKI